MMEGVLTRQDEDAESLAKPLGPAQDTHADSRHHLVTASLVWGIWGLMLLVHLAYVLRSTTPFPLADEVLLLSERLTPEWLWQQHAEHRVPLSKLLWLGGLQLTGYDFRAVNALSVLSVAATAAAMIAGATRLRGRVHYADAFFPLAMLSFGQAQNFLWAWVINHILPNMIACILLLAVAFRGRDPRLGETVLVAALLGLLYLSGPIGLPYLLAFAVWFGYRGALLWRHPRAPRDGRDGLITLGLAVASLALVGLYFVGYRVEPGTAAGAPVRPTGLAEQLKTFFRILCVSFGPVVKPYVQPLGLVLLGLILSGAVVLVRAWLGQPRERLRASGLLLFLGGTVALLLAVARSRAGLGKEYHLIGTYLNMAIPALCAVYLAGILYAKAAIGELIHGILFTLSCLFFLANYEFAERSRYLWDGVKRRIQQDIKAGMPPSIIAARRAYDFGFIPPWVPSEVLAGKIAKYKELGIPQFREVAAEPDYSEVRLPKESSDLDGVAYEDNVAYSTSPDPAKAGLGFVMDRPRFVYAIRLKCSYEDGGAGPATAEPRVTWSLGDAVEHRNGGGSGERMWVDKKPPLLAGDWGDRIRNDRTLTLTFWVDSKIDRLRIYPDSKPFEFKIHDIILFVPPGDAAPADSEPDKP